MTKRGVSIGRRIRQCYTNKKVFPYWKRTLPLVRYENELSTVCWLNKHKTPGQQGKSAFYPKKVKDESTQDKQYIRYLYPTVVESRLDVVESRLDVVTYHMDWSRTKSSSRQDVSHGHVLVNGKKVTTPAYGLKRGDVMEVDKTKAYRVGFLKPYYSSCEVNHRIRTAVFLNGVLPSRIAVCNVRSR